MPTPAVVAVDPLLDVADARDWVEDASTRVDKAAEGVVEAVADGVVEVTAVGGVVVVEAAALTGAPAMLVQKPCSGVTSG